MMQLLSKITKTSLITTLLLGVWLVEVPVLVEAQTCDANETPGNLLGYAITENLGPIYMSTESWNAANPSDPTSVSFYVNYDKQSGLWNGRAWNETVGWVDFDYDTLEKEARFESPGEAYDSGSDEWGNWPGVIQLATTQTVSTDSGNISVTPVRYSTQIGSFTGLGLDAALTGEGSDPSEDDYVGAGLVDFANVQFVNSDCQEYVDLFINDISHLHNSVCPIATPRIKWTSQGVSNCQTVEGLWNNPGTRANQNISGENASGPITDVNTPVTFRIRCVGQQSGADVYGIATASCGGEPVVDETTFNIVIWEN